MSSLWHWILLKFWNYQKSNNNWPLEFVKICHMLYLCLQLKSSCSSIYLNSLSFWYGVWTVDELDLLFYFVFSIAGTFWPSVPWKDLRHCLRAWSDLPPAGGRLLPPLSHRQEHGWGCHEGKDNSQLRKISINMFSQELIIELHSTLKPAYSDAPTLKASSKNNSTLND